MFEQDQLNSSSSGWSPGMFPGFVSEWRARGIVPLTAGLRLVSGVVMQMPLRQFRGDDEVIPAAPVVLNPAPANNGTLASYCDAYVEDISLYGNHVCLLGEPDSTGWPASILPVDVCQVSVAVHPVTGRLVYTYAETETMLDGSDLMHVALDRRSGQLVGHGLIPTMSAALSSASAAEEFAGRYFDESAIPTGVITDSRPDLSQDQADELKAAWLRTVGSRRRTPIVLPTSTTFTPLVSDAENAQLVQARQWNAQTVAMALGIPPFMLGIETQRHTYTNAENEFGRFIRTTIMRLLVPLEQQLSLQLLPRGNTAVFDTRNLLRPEAPARFTMAVQGFQAHLLTEGEARELMGYPADGGPGIGPADTGGIELAPSEAPQLALLPAPAPTPPEPVSEVKPA
jgi:HK97 family phage portal protein